MTRDEAMKTARERGSPKAYKVVYGERWEQGLRETIPPHMFDGVVNYVLFGIRPGSFLSAVIEGDLYEALRQADDINKHRLWYYGMFFHNYAPAACFGSKETVTAWCNEGGMFGRGTLNGVFFPYRGT